MGSLFNRFGGRTRLFSAVAAHAVVFGIVMLQAAQMDFLCGLAWGEFQTGQYSRLGCDAWLRYNAFALVVVGIILIANFAAQLLSEKQLGVMSQKKNHSVAELYAIHSLREPLNASYYMLILLAIINLPEINLRMLLAGSGLELAISSFVLITIYRVRHNLFSLNGREAEELIEFIMANRGSDDFRPSSGLKPRTAEDKSATAVVPNVIAK